MAGLRPTGIEYPVGSGTYIDIERDTSDYQAMFLADQSYAVAATPSMEPRRNSTGLLTSISVDGRTIPMTVLRKSSSAVTSATFHANVKRWFDPGKGRDGTRYLRILGDDGVTAYRLPVHVVSLAQRPGSIDVYDVTLQAVTPYFEALTETSTVITASGTVTNAGNARAQATLEITGGTSVNGNRYTITDTTGRGLINHPFVIADTAPTTSQADSFVLVGGASVAFTQGATSASYWIFIDLPASGSVTVDILRNTGVTNPLAGTLEMGNIVTSNTDNAQMQWDSWNVTSAPERPGIWHSVNARVQWTALVASSSYGIDTDTATQTTIATINSTSSPKNNNASAVLLSVGTVATLLANLKRAIVFTDAGRTCVVWYQLFDTAEWDIAWSSNASSTTTTSIAFPAGTVKVLVGIRATSDTLSTSQFTLSWNSIPGTLTLTDYPTLSSATATTWRVIDGTVANDDSGQVVTFDHLIRRDGTLTIAATSDYNQRRIQNSVSSPILGNVSFSDSVDLFSLEEGANDISETLNGSVTVKHRAAVL